MGLIDRVVDRVARRMVDIATTKAISPKDPGIMRIFNWGGETKDLTKPYSQLAIVYACINRVARTVANIPWKIYRAGSESEVTSGAIVDLFNRVNPFLSKYQLWEAAVVNMLLSGEAFIAQDPRRVGGVPVALWPLPPTDIKERLSSVDLLLGWEYRSNGRELFVPAELMIQPKLYSPYSALRGLSPMDSLRLTTQGMWSAQRVNTEAFERGVTPGTVYGTDQGLTDAQYERMHYQLIEQSRGVDNANKALLLEGGLKVLNARLSNKDMQFIEQINMSREEIMMVYGVPKSELSLDDEVNRAAATSTSLSFMKKTVMPMCTLLADKFNSAFLLAIGYQGAFDFSGVDVLNEELERKAAAIKVYHEVGVPFDVINEKLELGFPAFEGSDLPFAGRSQAPAVPGQPSDDSEDDQDEETDDEAQTEEDSKALDVSTALERYRGEIWKRVAAPLHSLQGRFTSSLRTYFHKAETTLRRVGEFSADGVTADWDEVFPPKELQKLARGYIEQAMENGARRGARLQRRINSEDPLARVLERRTVQITSITETLRKELTERIRAMIIEADGEGWTEDQRKEAVEEIVGAAFNAGSNRARTIARTELFAAYNESEWITLDSADEQPTHKEWISSRDDVVRDTHQMDGEIVKWEEPFSNGLMYPMDPAGPPEEVINCRCVMNPIWQKE